MLFSQIHTDMVMKAKQLPGFMCVWKVGVYAFASMLNKAECIKDQWFGGDFHSSVFRLLSLSAEMVFLKLAVIACEYTLLFCAVV